MDYDFHYYKLVETRRLLDRSRNNDGTLEQHHIIPRSLGGSDLDDNLVLLTPREHFIAHWLLYKMHVGQNKAKMAYAFFRMCSNNTNQKRLITARQYDIAKTAMQNSCKGINHPRYSKKLWSDEQKQAISDRQMGEKNTMYGKSPWNKGIKGVCYHSDETKQKLREQRLNKPRSEETKLKISQSHIGKSKSESHKEKLRLANLGKTRSQESIDKTANALRGKKHQIITCPYCNKTGGAIAMYRWHFDNCKDKHGL